MGGCGEGKKVKRGWRSDDVDLVDGCLLRNEVFVEIAFMWKRRKQVLTELSPLYICPTTLTRIRRTTSRRGILVRSRLAVLGQGGGHHTGSRSW